ncbi:MAG TPA: phosphatase PAP2 family protein [Vicinamibacterales bacterium]|nr:phosphatase PAP2 family protein [Vicinamibacterales bacterium]
MMRFLLTLRGWELASLVSFVYTALVAAFFRRGLPPSTRIRAVGGSVAGLLLTAASALAPFHLLLHGWLLPPALLLLGYWTSGLLFVAPMKQIEKLFALVDRLVDVRRVGSLAPVTVAEFLEFSYAAVFVLIPVALALHLALSPAPDSDRFWTVILVTDFICFAALPWIQTRPPRALEAGEPWSSSFRSFNLRWLGSASIQVNTFPSGHAAEAVAAALLVSNLRPSVFIWMLFNAAAVSAGAVFGRYHYAIDAFAGWLVAIAVWLVLMH